MPGQQGSSTATQQVPTPLTTDPFMGSVVTEKPTDGELQLTILDALERALRNNLGLLTTSYGNEAARAERLREFSTLLPKLNVNTRESIQQINLKAFGFTPPPGTPAVVGPFGVFDSRATLSESLLDFTAINNVKAAEQNQRAAQFSYQSARELVVLVAGNAYLLALADGARVETAQARLNTAKAVFERTRDQKNAGVAAGIDVLRSQVEMQAEQERLFVSQNDYEKQKLMLARIIGLAPGQKFGLADKVPFAEAPPVQFEDLLQKAMQQRPEYLQAQARLRAAEASKRAAEAERLPTLNVDGDYGFTGQSIGAAKDTYTLAGGVKIPVFQGGKVKADVQRAEATRKLREAELGDLRGRIETELRSALLDLNSASERVKVAQEAVQLATEQLQQAQDRFSAGVAGSLEVTQSQEALATANENLISSLYAHNVAKLLLAKAVGAAERQTKQFLSGGK